jgi:hypothetical protein
MQTRRKRKCGTGFPLREKENENKDIGIEEEQNGLRLPNVPALDPILIQ